MKQQRFRLDGSNMYNMKYETMIDAYPNLRKESNYAKPWLLVEDITTNEMILKWGKIGAGSSYEVCRDPLDEFPSANMVTLLMLLVE